MCLGVWVFGCSGFGSSDEFDGAKGGWFGLGFSRKLINTGVRVMARKASISRIRVFVQAKGANSFPSCPVSMNTGRKEVMTTRVEKKTPLPTCWEARSMMDSLLFFCGIALAILQSWVMRYSFLI